MGTLVTLGFRDVKACITKLLRISKVFNKAIIGFGKDVRLQITRSKARLQNWKILVKDSIQKF